jgi:hypothetical protein
MVTSGSHLRTPADGAVGGGSTGLRPVSVVVVAVSDVVVSLIGAVITALPFRSPFYDSNANWHKCQLTVVAIGTPPA